MIRARLTAAQREDLVLALVLTISVSLIPRWRVFEQAWIQDVAGLRAIPGRWYVTGIFLIAALALALSAPRRSGLTFGSIREHWKGVLLVCGGTILATALVYPQLSVRPWGDAAITMWTISPIAQELLFFGYIYGRLGESFPGYVHDRVPVARALVLTAMFFALWHAPNFFTLPFGYVLFQLFYTGVLAIIPGLARQWTGSVYYGIVTHAAVNLIAWLAS